MEMISKKNLKNHTFAVIFNKTHDFEVIFLLKGSNNGTATQQNDQTSSSQSLSGSRS